MGGEPTFVPIYDMEADEWNTTADGPHKRELAGDLIRRLRHTFGQGGILHDGQGKWYPGKRCRLEAGGDVADGRRAPLA